MTATLNPAPATAPATCAMPGCGATLTGVTGYIDGCGTVCEDCFGPTLEQILGPGWDRPLPF
jgi:hypothetical protein